MSIIRFSTTLFLAVQFGGAIELHESDSTCRRLSQQTYVRYYDNWPNKLDKELKDCLAYVDDDELTEDIYLDAYANWAWS